MLDFGIARPEGQWLAAFVRELQIAAAAPLNPRFDVFTTLAGICEAVPAPSRPVERLLAEKLLTDTAARLLDIWWRLHRSSDVAATPELGGSVATIRRVVAGNAWERIGAELRTAADSARRLSLVDRARQFIDMHYAKPLTLAALARHCGASVRSMTEQFRLEMGTTVHAYLTWRRVVVAMDLLSSERLKVEAAAAAVGFRGRSTLYHHLRRVSSRSPGSFHVDCANRAVSCRPETDIVLIGACRKRDTFCRNQVTFTIDSPSCAPRSSWRSFELSR